MIWETKDELTQVSDPIDEILRARNVIDIERFLYPKRSDFYLPEYDPFILQDMNLAVSRINQAIEEGESILVSGDYDADGVTSTSVLVMGLEELGADVDYHIPQRTDGYGLSKAIVDIAHKDGHTLIITCDNGIVCSEEVEYAKTLGIDVVITDHHEPQDKLPNAHAVVNPKRKDCSYPTKELAGCGVVFKLLQALNQFMNGDIRKAEKYLDIVCIGTVGDVMKLVGENRLITKYGLQKLREPHNKGLISLLRILKLDDKEEITVRHLGFNIVPVLNAAGRLYDPLIAVDLLVSTSKRGTYRLAKRMRRINEERQKLTEEWTKKITQHVDSITTLSDNPLLIIPYEEDIPEGLVGLIAGKLKEKYQKPVILMTKDFHDKTKFKGSGRSMPGYDMFEEISKFKSLLAKFGGHQAACGLTIEEGKLETFITALNENCTLSPEDLSPTLLIDYEIEPECITKEFAKELTLMEPFGNGNEKPLFMVKDVFVQYPKAIGSNGKHLKFLGKANEEDIDMLGWSMFEKYQDLGAPKEVDVAFHPSLNTWNGNTKVQLELKDIRISE